MKKTEKTEKRLSPATVINRISGVPLVSADKLAGKMTPEESEQLVHAYNTQSDPRGVLQRVRDRFEDEKRSSQSAVDSEQKSEASIQTTDQ